MDWYPWCPEAFERAEREGKPVLIDIGASWCHWCHVMDEGTYADTRVAAFLNEHFVSIKVDRDERPDIDARYQRAVSAMTGQGGWPLTVFCDSDGIPFYGGTYFPPSASGGMPGFIEVLKRVAEYYSGGEDREKYRKALMEVLKPPELEPQQAGRGELLAAFASVMEEVDMVHGGFGHSPKFPHAYAVELLMYMYHGGKREAASAIRRTLEGMQAGGIHDQLGGGFHRYSTDEEWIVPHFEKMAYDNAALLLNYVHGYQLFGGESFGETASSIVHFILQKLTGEDGFYASQDADATEGDDGDYWTWTASEASSLLEKGEFEVASLHFHLHGEPEMRGRGRHVLYRHMDLKTVASRLGISDAEAVELLSSAKRKMLAGRERRREPAVDRSIYSNYTGMIAASLLEYASVFQSSELADRVASILSRFAASSFSADRGFCHSPDRKVEGLLDDQIWMLHAFASLYCFRQDEETHSRLRRGVELLDLYATGNGLYSDRDVSGRKDVGLASIPHVDVYDAPVMSSNSAAALLFLKVSHLLGQEEYIRRAEAIVNALCANSVSQGPYASSIFLALHQLLNPPMVCHIVGDPNSDVFKSMWSTASSLYSPGKSVLLINASEAQEDFLSETARSMLGAHRNARRDLAFVCEGRHCSMPVETPAALSALLRTGISP